MSIQLVREMANDEIVCQAARVSTIGAASIDSLESAGLINFLMKGRHGSPFEHATMTFLIEAPIFVWREIMRHRIASYNEESGRYKKLRPIFYIPAEDRPLQQIGKPGAYSFVAGDMAQQIAVNRMHKEAAHFAYMLYEKQLDLGIAREVARMPLPVSIYSSAYVTMNSRGLMNFLSLRTKSPEHAQFESFPLKEITMVADAMEDFFRLNMPLTHEAWDKAGRVAP